MTRPILNISFSSFEIPLIIIGFAGVVMAIYLLVSRWSKLPDIVATHFDFGGQPDDWHHKKLLAIFPVSAAIMILMGLGALIALPASARVAANVLCAEIIWLLIFCEWETIEVALKPGRKLNTKLLSLMVGIIFIEIIAWIYFDSNSR